MMSGGYDGILTSWYEYVYACLKNCVLILLMRSGMTIVVLDDTFGCAANAGSW
jgi:hypothetical protein